MNTSRAQVQQVNDALRVLNEMHRLHRIERGEYRCRRRRLLESLGDAGGSTVPDTVRRAVPAGDTLPMPAPVQCADAGLADFAATGERRAGARWAAACVLTLVLAACAAAACWLVTASP
ncbi:hypothetical protein [Paraburkholderia caffeinilytica]|uniref:hypothetical protein n=1 Tax=Paraburkholderia caffeinilytica TaxID=1761016 RepID=UPI0038B6EED2